jgi:predicted nucleic acid-binding protein
LRPRVVVLDACVMVPISICDTLLRAAERGIYAVRWSETILAELERSLALKLPLGDDRARRRVGAQSRFFPDAEVRGFERHIGELTNNPKDRHVLAAAVESQAEIIVTFNMRDFPERALQPWGVVAQSPDTFLCNLFTLEPEVMVAIIDEQASDIDTGWEALLARLSRNGAPRFTEQMRQYIHELQLPMSSDQPI